MKRRRPPSPARRARATEALSRLKRAYPAAACALRHGNPLELLVATILSAQCTDARVNLVTPRLFARCSSASDYAAIPAAELEAPRAEGVRTVPEVPVSFRDVRFVLAPLREVSP